MTIAWYQWHPYEAQAMVCGIFTGCLVGFRVGVVAGMRRAARNGGRT